MRIPIWMALLAIFAVFTSGILFNHWYENKSQKLGDNPADYIKKPNFKPDTVYLPGAYTEVKVPYGIPVKPKIVVRYIDTGKTINTHDTTNIFNKEITKYPDTWINYAEIGKDTLRLDYFSIGKTPHTEYILTDYSKYKYQYLDNSIFAKELKTTNALGIPKKESFMRYNGTYIYSGYEVTDKRISVGGTTGFNLGKIRLSGFIALPINKGSQSPVYGGRIGYKIF